MQHLTPLTTFVGSKKLHIVENISLVLSLQFASPIFIVMVSSSRCGIVQQRTKIILATFLRNNCRKQNVAYCHYISQSFIFIFSLWNCPTKNKKTTLRWEIQFWHNWWDILKEHTQVSCKSCLEGQCRKIRIEWHTMHPSKTSLHHPSYKLWSIDANINTRHNIDIDTSTSIII